MVIPFFLTLIIGLLLLIRIAFLQIALQNAADETVKQMAVIMYPLEPSLNQVVTMKDEWLSSLSAWVPAPMKPAIEKLLIQQRNESLSGPVLSGIFKPIYWYYVDQSYKESLIRYDQLHIEHITIPFINSDDSLFGIEVSYNFRISLPFYQKTIIIRKRAYERVWFGA